MSKLMPDLTVVAEGEAPGGDRWELLVGGPANDYWTMLETVYRDGRRARGGAAGPALSPDDLLSLYTGRFELGPLQVIVRAGARVRRVRLVSEAGERFDMLPAAHVPAIGVTLFAGLLPWTADVVWIEGLDDDGHVLSP
ncbi:MAG TPA: hypothetical protein VK599_15595 [Streptosporangiaceae bacterium]|jgi:hypothetical protein|nr:hypothetical protein [Streptosporangiaceae bacterium]